VEKRLQELILEDKQSLIPKLIESNYAFAVWKLPENDQLNFILSLSTPVASEQNLSNLDKGFIINQFKENHPAKFFYLPADIILDNEELHLDPRVSGSEIDQLLNELSKPDPKTKKKEKLIDTYESKSFTESVKRTI